MKILALEPYYGGSHRAFLDGFSASSGHKWMALTLPAYKWKWRMRHSAITFADQVAQLLADGQSWDLLFCSDMLNLAEFRGLAPAALGNLPTIVYFHENQLTYPVRFESERDYQFAMTNMTTAICADAVWFNSAFHRSSFIEAAADFLKRMPDFQPTEVVEKIAQKAQVHPPGITDLKSPAGRKPGPVRILWAARWEHDKRPQDFFEALTILKNNRIEFRISVIGQAFRDVPDVFKQARKDFTQHIDRWSYQKNRDEYKSALAEADVIVSTAEHEFFGLSVVEAIAAGAYPVLPKRLAYPRVLALEEDPGREKFFYDGSVAGLADRLAHLARQVQAGDLPGERHQAARLVERFKWKNLTPVLDKALDDVVSNAANTENRLQ
jgi:glycosyltransferase involved in cell wall biosynthesis